MRSIKFILLLLFLLATEIAVGRISYESVDEIINLIKSQQTDEALNDFLVEHDFIEGDEWKIRNDWTNSSKDSFVFHADKIKVDIFKKNLFGEPGNEIIFQLREEGVYSVNVFYFDGKIIKKVPEFIFSLIHGEKFIFYFENIAAENVFSLVSKSSLWHQRTFTETMIIWNIQPTGITRIYSMDTKYTSYSGVLTYNFNTTRDYHFELRRNYPKKLIVKVNTLNYENMKMNQDGDTLSGKEINVSGTKIVHFKYDSSGLSVSKIEEDIHSKTRFINNKDSRFEGKE